MVKYSYYIARISSFIASKMQSSMSKNMVFPSCGDIKISQLLVSCCPQQCPVSSPCLFLFLPGSPLHPISLPPTHSTPRAHSLGPLNPPPTSPPPLPHRLCTCVQFAAALGNADCDCTHVDTEHLSCVRYFANDLLQLGCQCFTCYAQANLCLCVNFRHKQGLCC